MSRPSQTLVPKLDWKRLTTHAESFAESLIKRGDARGKERLQALFQANELRKEAQRRVDVLNANRHKGLVDREAITREREAFRVAEERFHALCTSLPNWTHPQVREGAQGVIVNQSHDPKQRFEGTDYKDHLDLLHEHDLADFAAASKTSGSRFVFLKNQAVSMELALQRVCIDMLGDQFTLISTPELVRRPFVEACGFQPRDEESSQIYNVEDADLCLIGTSEIVLAAMLSGETQIKKPSKFLGFSHCFRTEAGAGGKHSRGLYRLHQFAKAEMFVCCHEQESEQLHQELVDNSVRICQAMGLTYRVVDMPSLELGASAYRKFDVEVFTPGSQRWGEVASITNTIDYQSRRLNIRCSDKTFAHTLNGTACAIPRMILAILETHQQDDGRIRLPPALAKVCGFDSIAPQVHESY